MGDVFLFSNLLYLFLWVCIMLVMETNIINFVIRTLLYGIFENIKIKVFNHNSTKVT